MQGFMGGVLVREQNIFNNTNKSSIAAKAIEEHYLPAGANSPLPSTIEGSILSLADKLDSLCIMICNGAEVKGNKDPFGMRRLALGIARLLGIKAEQNSILISVSAAVDICLNVICETNKVTNESKQKIHTFILDRMKAALDGEFDPRSVDALSKQLLSDPLLKVRSFAVEIANALSQSGKGSLLEALIPYKRAKKLIQGCVLSEIDVALFKASEEIALYEKVLSVEIKIKLQAAN